MNSRNTWGLSQCLSPSPSQCLFLSLPISVFFSRSLLVSFSQSPSQYLLCPSHCLCLSLSPFEYFQSLGSHTHSHLCKLALVLFLLILAGLYISHTHSIPACSKSFESNIENGTHLLHQMAPLPSKFQAETRRSFIIHIAIWVVQVFPMILNHED